MSYRRERETAVFHNQFHHPFNLDCFEPEMSIRARRIPFHRPDSELIGNRSHYQKSLHRAKSAAERGEVPKFRLY